ncbi:hypothetical protein GCM10027168_19670 [Streptomyces capparidis]
MWEGRAAACARGGRAGAGRRGRRAHRASEVGGGAPRVPWPAFTPHRAPACSPRAFARDGPFPRQPLFGWSRKSSQGIDMIVTGGAAVFERDRPPKTFPEIPLFLRRNSRRADVPLMSC